ncbi:MAG: fibronectin type III domain-containing protein [Janthinobacterium lividum]
MPTKPPLKLSDASGLLDNAQPTDRITGFAARGQDPATNVQWSLQTLANFFAGTGNPAANPGSVGFYPIAENEHGTHPAFETQDELNVWMLEQFASFGAAINASRAIPDAPTNGHVDDAGNILYGTLVPGYSAVADYEVFGALAYPGVVNAAAAGGDVQDGIIYSRGLTGPIDVGAAGIRVAASGNRPAGHWLLNDRAFTGPATTPAPTTDTTSPNVFFTTPAAGAVLAPNTPVTLAVNATDNVAVQGLVFTNGATGAVLGTGSKNGNTYTLPYTTGAAGPLSLVATAIDAAGNSQSATVNVTVGSAQPTTTNLSPPTGLSVIALSSSSTDSSWNAVANSDSYTLQRAANFSFTQNVTIVYGGTSTSAEDDNLTAGDYYYRVAAVGSGTYATSDPSGVVKVTVQAAAPTTTKLDPPSGLTVVALSSTSIRVTYTSRTNATGYRLRLNGGTTYMPGTATQYDITGLAPGATYSVEVQALYSGSGPYEQSDYSASEGATTPASGGVTQPLKFRSLLFDDNGGGHYLAGDTRTNLTAEISFSYTAPSGTALRDATNWWAGGVAYFAHSGYVSAPFLGNCLVVSKLDNTGTSSATGTAVHRINMLLSGRVPAVPGYPTVGNNAIFSSPSYVPRPNGKVGLFFMYQPDQLASTSYIMYIESLDSTFTSWTNARQVNGAAMPYNNGGGQQSGSYIDPFYFYLNGKHYLFLRCFTSGNDASTCLGLRIFESNLMLSGYNTVKLDLYSAAVNADMSEKEGQQIYVESDGTLTALWDEFAARGTVYVNGPDLLTNAAAYLNMQPVGKPAGVSYRLRHGDIRDSTLPVVPIADDSSNVNLGTPTTPTDTTPPYTPPTGIVRLDDKDSRLFYVGSWQVDENPQVEFGGSLHFLQSAGYVEYAAFAGGLLRIVAPGFGSSAGYAIYVDNVFIASGNYFGAVGDGIFTRFEKFNMPHGVLQIRWFSPYDLHIDYIEVNG